MKASPRQEGLQALLPGELISWGSSQMSPQERLADKEIKGERGLGEREKAGGRARAPGWGGGPSSTQSWLHWAHWQCPLHTLALGTPPPAKGGSRRGRDSVVAASGTEAPQLGMEVKPDIWCTSRALSGDSLPLHSPAGLLSPLPA